VDETRWLSSTDPNALLAFVEGTLSERKLRLFATASARRVWDALLDERSQQAIEATERFVEGLASAAELATAEEAGMAVAGLVGLRLTTIDAGWAATRAAGRTGHTDSRHAARMSWKLAAISAAPWARDPISEEILHHGEPAARAAAEQFFADLVRDIVGNPFRLIPFSSSWRTPDVHALAGAAYQERLLPSGRLDPYRLAVLADALEEVGAEAELVAHLRRPDCHVRGCWAVDCVLGRS
jgi:hypothetical protein